MDPNKGEISQLEMLPHDLLGIIVSKVVSISAEDYYNCILSCKELGASANDERVLKKVNLAPLTFKGHYYLGLTTKGGKKEAIYLYAILLLSAGKITEGKLYFIQIRWIVDTTMVKTCWKNIKASLHGIRVARKRRYVLSLQQIKPTTFYHLRDLDNTCGKSFYYKRMYKFIFLV
ncbi:putative F-box protein [Arabidopsis thaliana]